jgi:hypothetical protein
LDHAPGGREVSKRVLHTPSSSAGVLTWHLYSVVSAAELWLFQIVYSGYLFLNRLIVFSSLILSLALNSVRKFMMVMG